jgi:hypothetical protein
MPTPAREGTPELIIDFNEPRPLITPFQKIKFHVGDKVWFRATDTALVEGPFMVASVTDTGKYVLCQIEDMQTLAKNGLEVEERQLMIYVPSE